MKKQLSLFSLILCSLVTYAQADYNYTFYPAAKYARYTEQWVADTTTRMPVLKADSTSAAVPAIVEKNGDLLTIRALSNISESVYTAKVHFQGLLQDGQNSLFYRADTPDQESIIINPTLGYVAVIFQKCTAKPGSKPGEPEKQCSTICHYFGAIALRSYKP